jgi:hypothetical protein
MNPCAMKGCYGIGTTVTIDAKLDMKLCPRHSIEVKEFGFQVDDPTGDQPWLQSIRNLEPIAQADGAA